VIEQPQPNERAAYKREWMRAHRAQQKHERAPSAAPTFTPGMHRGTDVGVRPGDADWYLGKPDEGNDPAHPETYRYKTGAQPTPDELARYRAAYLTHPNPLATLAGPRWSGCELVNGRYVVSEASKAPPLAEQQAEQAARRVSTNRPRGQGQN
jgi:hypothetical protein